MADKSIVQTIKDAEIDARSLSEFVSKGHSFTVTRRLAPTIHTLDYYLLVLNKVKDKGDLADIAISDTLDKLEQLEPTVIQRVEDAINNTAVEGGVLADTFVVSTVNSAGSVARTQRDKNSDTISVKDFGAVGDGVTVNDTALIAALASGKPLDWGGVDDTYLVTTNIAIDLNNALHWKCNGATIKFELASHVANALLITTANHDITIENRLNIVVNKKANVGVRIKSASTVAPNLTINNINISGCRRANNDFIGGEGLSVHGLFDIVDIYKPIVKDIAMAAGAGVSGSQGVAGVVVSRDSEGNCARIINITEPYIEEVYSEDLDYTMDQDGIKVFTDILTTTDRAAESVVNIINPIVKNSLGRGIKVQSENCNIINPHFIRNRGFNRGYGNPEIDMQFGGGRIENMSFDYDGSIPECLVASSLRANTAYNDDINMTPIRGVKGTIRNQTEYMRMLFFFSSAGNPVLDVSVSDVVIRGESNSARVSDAILVSGDAASGNITLKDIKAACIRSFVHHKGNFFANINVFDADNTYRNECELVYTSLSGTAKVNSLNINNVQEMRAFTASQTQGDGLELETIRPKTDEPSSGLVKVKSFHIPVGETKLGNYGFYSNIFTAIISIAQSTSTQFIIASGSSSMRLLAGESSTVVTVGVTKPETGTYRFYYQDGEFTVENNSSTSRVMTMMVIG